MEKVKKEKKKLDFKYVISIIIGIAVLLDILSLIFPWKISGFFCTRFVALCISTNVFLKQLTNGDKKVSKFGTIIICFSSAVLTGMNFDIITFGEIFLTFLNKITDAEIRKDETEKDKKIKKILYAVGMFISIIAYVLTFNLSLEIAFGYVFLALAIWILIKNRKKYKFTGKTLAILVISIVCILGIFSLVESFTGLFSDAISTYKVERTGNGLQLNFSYVYNFLMPYKNTGENTYLASMISVFPVPIILACIYLYKKEKHEEFLFPMICVVALEFVWSMINLPQIISLVTGFTLVSVKDVVLGLALANIYIFLYMYANIDEEILGTVGAIRIALIVIILDFLVPRPEVYSAKGYMYLFAAILTLESFLMLSYSDKRYKNVSLWLMVIITLIGTPILFLG
jgi:hypothetical protein